MKNNILNRFAFNDLKIHKKDSLSLLIMIFISSLIIFTLSFISQTYNKEKYDEYKQKYGTYSYYSTEFDGSIEGKEIELFGEDIPLSQLDYAVLEKYGNDLNGHTLLMINGNPEVVGVQLSKGRFPENTNEIIINERYLKEYNCDYDIDDMIELTYIDELYPYYTKGNIKTREVKIVGFINELSDYPLVVKLDKPIDYQLYFATPNNAESNSHSVSNEGGFLSLARNTNVDKLYTMSTVAYTLALAEIVTFIISVTLIYSVSIVSFEKKQRDYTLLRSIGITQKQLYYIVFIQTLILSAIPVLFACIIHYIASMIINTGVSLDIYLWNIFKVITIVFVGYFIPAHSITRQSLLGSFEGVEFRRFYYQYKKLHKMRPFYLGYRSLIALKKPAFLKIILLAVISFQILDLTSQNSLDENKPVQTGYQYNMAYYINSKPLPSEDSWDFMKEYTNHIYILPCIENSGESRIYIYSDTQDVKNFYKYQYNVDEGKCLINGERLVDLKDNFDNTFVFDESTRYVVLHKNDYERYKMNWESQNVIFVFDSFQQKNNMLKSVSSKLSSILLKNTVSIDELNYNLMYKQYLESQKPIETNLKVYIFLMSLIVVYIFLFSLESLHHKEDIGTYQLIGMTSKEIKHVYFYKSFIISFVGFILGGIYYMLTYYSLIRSKDVINYLVLPPIITWIVLMVIIVLSLISLHTVLKGSGFDNKLTRD